jgi:hypothetical protein
MEKTADENEITLLKEILKWIKFAGMNQVKAVLEEQLKEDSDKIIYQNSDGTLGVIELGKLSGVSKSTVGNLWETWVKTGLGNNIPVRGGSRFKRSFDLKELGISVPEIKESTKDSDFKNQTGEKGHA